MARVDEFQDTPEDEARREEIVQAGYAAQHAIAVALTTLPREDARQEREDEFASWAMEIIMRARQRIGRTKWSTAEGVVKRRIVEALRCLPSDD